MTTPKETPKELPKELPKETPLDPLVAEMVALLDANLREAFEERAAIIEFEAVLPRAHAECLALLDVLRGNPEVLLKASKKGRE